MVQAKLLGTPIPLFSCLSRVTDGGDRVFLSELRSAFRLCCKMIGLLPEQFPEEPGGFELGLWALRESDAPLLE